VPPVIHSGAFHGPIIEFESERFDQVEMGLRGRAEAGDGAGVGWDFRFDEDDLEAVLGGHVAYFDGAGYFTLIR
jgi:hypothetical protein